MYDLDESENGDEDKDSTESFTLDFKNSGDFDVDKYIHNEEHISIL